MVNKNYRIFLVIFLIVSILGVMLIDYSSKSNEYMEGKIYFFEFGLMNQDFIDESNNRIHVQDFCFYYDFTKNKGNITFDFDHQDWFLSYIDVKFPSLVKSKTINIYSIKNGVKIDSGADIEITEHKSGLNGINYTHLEISNFKKTFNDEKFVIEFESNLEPNGNFLFNNNFYNILHSNDKQGNVNFVLGDDYECVGDCVYNLEFMEETKYSSDRNLKFKFIEDENRNDKKIKINAVNRTIKWKKTFYLGLGISFIVAAFNSIFMILYENNKTKSNLKKRDLKIKETMNKLVILLNKYKLSLFFALMVIFFIIISFEFFGEVNPTIAAVGALLFSIPVRFFFSSYMAPVLKIKENTEIRNFNIGSDWEYKANSIIISNMGKSAATNCKGYIINKNKERVCWTVQKERPNATINAKDEERLDICAYYEKGISLTGGDSRKLPDIVAPTEEGWSTDPFDCRNLNGIDEAEVLITADNAEPVKAKIKFHTNSCSIFHEK